MMATAMSEDAALDAREIRWAAEEIAALVRQTAPGSIVCTVLQQTLLELTSLKRSLEGLYCDAMRMNAAA
jgi:hypothetical protein